MYLPVVLPDKKIQLQTISSALQHDQRPIFYRDTTGILSHFHPSSIKFYGKIYSNTEQLYQAAKKADFFNNHHRCEKHALEHRGSKYEMQSLDESVTSQENRKKYTWDSR
uniref:Uncharacterized protein n=1 Tax=Romanomermis culicivorax TaxID=13658 RepID=A0A915IBW8_ROMCU